MVATFFPAWASRSVVQRECWPDDVFFFPLLDRPVLLRGMDSCEMRERTSVLSGVARDWRGAASPLGGAAASVREASAARSRAF